MYPALRRAAMASTIQGFTTAALDIILWKRSRPLTLGALNVLSLNTTKVGVFGFEAEGDFFF